MSLETVKVLLRKRIGLDPDLLGPAVLPSVVAARQRVLGIPEMPAYAARVQKSPREFDALVNELVVSETWFFRSGQLFPFLAQYIRQTVGGRSPAHPFRALSAPSSTGEEPYSLAIALTELQVPRAVAHRRLRRQSAISRSRPARAIPSSLFDKPMPRCATDTFGRLKADGNSTTRSARRSNSVART